jgi:hypothetical protein
MAPLYHIVVIRVILTSWAHVWRLHFYFLGMGYDKWYQSHVDHRTPALLNQMLLRTYILQNYFFLVPIFWGSEKNVILHSSCSNDRWLALTSQPARSMTISPLVSWYLRTCHRHKSLIMTQHHVHLRRRSLLRLS